MKIMALSEENRQRIGRCISIAAIVLAAIAGWLALRDTTENPRTDDA